MQLGDPLSCMLEVPGSRKSGCIFRFAEATGHEVVVIDLPENGSEAPTAPGSEHGKR